MSKDLNKDWKEWIALKDPISALEYQLCDRTEVLTQFCAWGQVEGLPVYYWNPGYRSLQQVNYSNGKCTLTPADVIQASGDILQVLLESADAGIYLLEGVLDFDVAQGQLSAARSFQLSNAFYRGIDNQYWVLLDSYIELPRDLQPLVSTFSKPLPTRLEATDIVFDFCSRSGLSADDESRSALVQAALGYLLVKSSWF